MATQYSSKMPDMSRNTALAGKTVYSNGMNVTYDSNGYATRASNPNHSSYAGTTRSVHAQPIEDALAGKEWTPPDTSGLREWDGSEGWGSSSGKNARSTGGAYDGGYGGGYPSAYDALRAANDAAVRLAVAQLTAQKTAANESYDDYARQAYRDKMGAERDIGQYLGARGITGGAAESTVLGLNTSYADELRRIEQSRRETLSALDQAISEAQLTGDLKNAQAAAEAAKEQASLYAQEMAERKAAAAAQEQSERAEAKEQQSWARTLAGQMLAAGRMPDDATLAAAGITRAQAELLLTQTETDVTDVYTPTFTLAQVRSEIENARKYGTHLSAKVLQDYEYYYGEPYGGTSGGTAGGTKSGGSGGGTPKASDNNGVSEHASIDYDEDEGIFTWNGKRYLSLEALASAIDSAGLTPAEKAALTERMRRFGFALKIT